MSLFRKPMFWFALSTLFTIMIVWGGTSSDVQKLSRFMFLRFERVDLVMHFSQFAILTWLLFRWFDTAGLLVKVKFFNYIPLIICFAIGGLNEYVQSHIPNRSGAWDDQIANSIGSLLVTFFYIKFVVTKLKHKLKRS